jgi:hypothetical protein
MDEFNEKEKGKEKIKGLMTEDEIRKRKIRKRKTVVSVFVFLLAVGIGGNWYWENSDISSKVDSITSPVRTLGEATFVDAAADITESKDENEYFSSARLERQQSRDEALENLQTIITSTSEDDEARKIAAEKVSKISSFIEIENKIETFLKQRESAMRLRYK